MTTSFYSTNIDYVFGSWSFFSIVYAHSVDEILVAWISACMFPNWELSFVFFYAVNHIFTPCKQVFIHILTL